MGWASAIDHNQCRRMGQHSSRIRKEDGKFHQNFFVELCPTPRRGSRPGRSPTPPQTPRPGDPREGGVRLRPKRDREEGGCCSLPQRKSEVEGGGQNIYTRGGASK